MPRKRSKPREADLSREMGRLTLPKTANIQEMKAIRKRGRPRKRNSSTSRTREDERVKQAKLLYEYDVPPKDNNKRPDFSDYPYPPEDTEIDFGLDTVSLTPLRRRVTNPPLHATRNQSALPHVEDQVGFDDASVQKIPSRTTRSCERLSKKLSHNAEISPSASAQLPPPNQVTNDDQARERSSDNAVTPVSPHHSKRDDEVSARQGILEGFKKAIEGDTNFVNRRIKFVRLLEDIPDYSELTNYDRHKKQTQNPPDILTLKLIEERMKRDRDYARSLDWIRDLWKLKFVAKKNLEQRRKQISEKFFDVLMDPDRLFSTELRACCFVPRLMAPNVICHRCDIVIPPNGRYRFNDGASCKDEQLLNIPVHICEACFRLREWRKPEILDPDPLIVERLKTVDRKSLKLITNTESQDEPTLECKKCGGTFHRNCVKFISPPPPEQMDFVCEFCLTEAGEMSRLNVEMKDFGSVRSLPETELSKFIEDYVRKVAWNPDDGRVFIRVVSSIPKAYELSDNLSKFLQPLGVDSKFPYLSRVIFGFQEAPERSEDSIVFVALYFQEYDNSCPNPNKNSIYISMLDSTQLLRVSGERKKITYSIIVSYMAFMRKRGFLHVYLWSCPPLRREIEYIFHRRFRPPKSRSKTQSQLNTWYQSMIGFGTELGIINGWSNLYPRLKDKSEEEFFQSCPYFYEDHWAKFMENAVSKRIGKQLEGGVEVDHEKLVDPKIMKMIHKEIMKEMAENMKSFFYIDISDNSDSDPVTNLDVIMPSSLVDNRENLIKFFRSHELEFADHRKGAFSTKAIITEITCEDPVLVCSSCSRKIILGFWCTECEGGLQLCEVCMRFCKHEHRFKKIISPRMHHMKHIPPEKGEVEEIETLRNSMMRCARPVVSAFMRHRGGCSLSLATCPTCIRFQALFTLQKCLGGEMDRNKLRKQTTSDAKEDEVPDRDGTDSRTK